MKCWLMASMVVALAACSGTKSSVRDALGIDRSAPDAFKVVSRPPLSVPPEFDLRPPQPGAEPLGSLSSEAQAESLIKSGDLSLSRDYTDLEGFAPQTDTTVTPVMSAPLGSAADAAFLSKAGAEIADDTIRQKLSEEAAQPVANPDADFAIYRWLGAEDEADLVDPKAESERIRENVESGKPVNEGETKTIEDEPNTLDLLF